MSVINTAPSGGHKSGVRPTKTLTGTGKSEYGRIMTEKQQALEVQCPSCKQSVIWDRNNPHRPFCSAQCKNQDFVSWANEEHSIAGDPLHDGVLSGDIDLD